MKKLHQVVQEVGSFLFPKWINDPCPQALRNALGSQPMLTFDDVDESAILDILSILEKTSVTAAFFVTGQDVENNQGLLRQIKSHGHIIGNHSFSHPDLRTLPLKEAKREITRTQEILSEFEAFRWFRPPYGAISKRLSSWLLDEGYEIVLWSLDSGDWRRGATVEKIVNAIGRAHHNDMILLHAKRLTVQALPQILDCLNLGSPAQHGKVELT